jgi:hypothetical protein
MKGKHRTRFVLLTCLYMFAFRNITEVCEIIKYRHIDEPCYISLTLYHDRFSIPVSVYQQMWPINTCFLRSISKMHLLECMYPHFVFNLSSTFCIVNMLIYVCIKLLHHVDVQYFAANDILTFLQYKNIDISFLFSFGNRCLLTFSTLIFI